MATNTTSSFTLGQTVENFGLRAIVWGYHTLADGTPSGMLVLRELKPSGLGCKWVADPAKCTPVLDGVAHMDGFVTF